VRLEPGVAVVVGPNGSGKSNISDAIVWAAGSLTPSELRAEKPDDVLFAGSPGRDVADSCEVELLFDNEAGDGPLDYSELSVTRRLQRDGEGQYLVNRSTVRRTDLVDLLSDLGLGHGMHSIIGQGKVDEVLTSRPADRRALIEEAAGLAKFKRRRHRDVEAEVKKRLRPLAMQASAAERAEKLRGQIASLEARIAELDLAGIAERRGEAESRRESVCAAQSQTRSELERLLSEREQAEQELEDAAGTREAALAALYRLRGSVERAEVRREGAESLAAELDDLLSRSRRSTSSEARTEEESEPSELERLEAEARELRARRSRLESEIADAASTPETQRRLLVGLSGTIERLSMRRESLVASLERSREELTEAEALESSGAPSYGDLVRAEERAASRSHELELECDRAQERARHAAERLSALEHSISEREGIPPAARALAETGELLALSLLEVEPGYERAVTAALAWRAAALIAPDPKKGLQLLERARRDALGGLAVVLGGGAGGRETKAPPVAGATPLSSVVSGDWRAKTLLDGIWLVELERLSEAASGVVVTREGHGYDADQGELWLASDAGETLLLQLESRRRELRSEVERLFGEAASAEKLLEQAHREHEKAKKSLSEIEPDRRRNPLPLPVLRRLVASASRLERALDSAAALGETLREPLEVMIEQGGSRVARLSGELRDLATSEAALQQSLARTRERVAEAHTRARVTRAHPPEAFCLRLSTCAGRLVELMRSIPELARSLETPLREEVESGAGRSGELGAALRRLGAEEAAVRDRASAEGERLAQIGVELARLDSEREDAERRLRAGEVEPAEGEDREELERTLERGRRRLEDLGRVNPLAKEEYAEEKAHLEELATQRADLEESLAELEKLIAELTGTVEQRFAETYELVSQTFEEVASTLFPGGEGRLRMTEPAAATEPESDEEPGIEIELRPAGKRVSKLSLLSGGEKSLGAICFLFALFLAHPCPFYLLDEVEAALDDTNIGRFVELLRGYSSQAQFVVITHQKRTMEAADLLYGVTMGGDGVSQIVSRRTPREPELALESA
jgi:chromosome segregation protein